MAFDRVRREISQRNIPDGKGAFLNVTVSIGVAPVGSIDLSMDNAVKNADQALYEAKETGRNQVICAKAH